MGNPIKTSKLYENTGELKELIKELELVQEALIKLRNEQVTSAKVLSATIKKTTTETTKQKEEIEETAKKTDDVAKAYKKYNKSIDDNAKQIQRINAATKEQNELNKQSVKIQDSAVGSTNALNAELKLNKKRLDELTESEKNNTIEGRKLMKKNQELKKALDDVKKSEKLLTVQTVKLTAVQKLEKKVVESKEGSYNQLSAQYSLNKIALNKLSKEERSNTKAGRELVTTTDDIYTEMKRLQKETGKTTLNVGNYEEALGSADAASGGFIGSVKAIGKSFMVLLANPIVLFLTLIVGALAALGNAFKSSDKGARLLEKGTALVSAGFSILVELSVKLVEGIENVFGDAANSKIGKFAGILKDLIIVRVKGLINALSFLGETIGALADGDFKKMKEAGVNAAAAINQAITGIQLGDDSELLKGLEKVVEKVDETAKAFVGLAVARLATQRANRELTKSVEQLTTKEAVLRTFADDTTKSFKEREKANEDAIKVLENKSALEVRIAKNNLSLINSEIDLRRKSGENVEVLLDNQLSAYSALKQAERDFTLAVRDNERTRDELKQDRLERDLDILLDGFDNQKTINEKLIASDELTFEKRREILEETNKLSDSSFAKQIETLQKFTGISINSNELIGESDAIVLNQKIRSLGLSEIIEGRLLEIVRDRKSANQELTESEQDLNNAVKKSQEEQLEYRKSLIEKAKAAYNDFEEKRKQGIRDTFEQRQELANSEFDLLVSTEDEKTKFALKAEKERLLKIIELNKSLGGKLSDIQIETLKNQIKKIDQEIEKVGGDDGEEKDIYDLLGFNLDDEQKKAISQSVNFVTSQISDILSARSEAAKEAVSIANTEVEQAQRTVQIEQDKLLAGEANRVQSAQRDLENAKKTQAAALKEQQKAQQAQNALDTAQQAVSLITASANIFKTFTAGFGPAGSVLAVGAIAAMFGTFIASKVKANKLVKKTFGKGTYEVLKGGSHASGDDIGLGMMGENTERRAEGGEGLAIFAKSKVNKYRTLLPDVVKSINSGTFEEMFMRKNLVADEVGNFVLGGNSGGSVDLSRSEKLLEKIGENTSGANYTNAKGNSMEIRKNVKTEYV
ncbi:MAG: putative structural protein [Prokaryotic dsDNA virus sp.]|nr:MAG: putative structural protein [Prokaryotic dsDNA virus sp.]|tara:strand:- start:38765 stop:42040 length:3276 start_codon:yes stop_codon:yes gene_type:complete